MQINKTCEKYCLGRQHTVNSQSSTFDKNTGTYCNNPLLHNQPQHNYPHRDGWFLPVFGSHCSNKTGTLYNAVSASFPYRLSSQVTPYYSHLSVAARCDSCVQSGCHLLQKHEGDKEPLTIPKSSQSKWPVLFCDHRACSRPGECIRATQTQTPVMLFFCECANFCSKKHVLCLM